MPTTRTVSIREFRENMTKFLREAQEKNVHFVIMRHAEPIAHVTPLKKKRQNTLEQLKKDIAEERREVREGKLYTPEQVLKMLDL